MKQIISWLQAKLSRSKSIDPPSESESADPDELNLPREMQDLVNDTPPPDSVEYKDDVTVPDLRLHDQPSSDADKTTGVDPSDTAKIHKK